jgi:DNA polymerase-3 subunit delta'
MTSIVGHAAAASECLAAMSSGALHHAWLIAGPEGIGKATFARSVAARMLAEAADPGRLPPTLNLSPEHRTATLLSAGAHPDYRELRRLPKESDKTGEELARSITIAQVRALQPMLATKPALSGRRVILIDAIDELERPGASNALLKNLEEPPAGTIFLLVSHAPGRLLPTIRSRCRLLRLEPLGDVETGEVLRRELPEASEAEIASLTARAEGSPGRAMRFAGLDVEGLDRALEQIASDGDPTNARRSSLSKSLAGKAAQPRYEAFLERVPAFIAAKAKTRQGEALRTTLDAYTEARELGRASLGLSLDPATTVFEMGRIVATLAEARGRP